MKHWQISTLGVWTGLAMLLTSGGPTARAEQTNVEGQVHVLQQQNAVFQDQLRRQQELIDSLTREVTEIRESKKRDYAREQSDEMERAASSGGASFGKLRISGEGAVGIFDTGSEGQFPNAEFRVDEGKLFLDAAIWGDVYAFAELNLAARDGWDLDLRLGEFYLDFEDVSKLWGQERQLNIRAGRLDVPFGEEYIRRDAIDNPLISHSLSDLWGVDEGVELYGAFGKVSYVVAVQNGGVPVTRDFTSDKSVAGRVSYDPTRWLHVSASGMRTGDLSVAEDGISEIWFGNGWFRSIGSPGTTQFHANLVEGDVIFRLPRGEIRIFGGYIYYDDNDPTANNRRDVYYYSVEAAHDLTRQLYAGARFSQIFANKGFPIVGQGNMDEYFFGPLVEDMWRLSLALGYRFSRHLLIKVEYSLERGREVGGGERDQEDMVAAQAAFGF